VEAATDDKERMRPFVLVSTTVLLACSEPRRCLFDEGREDDKSVVTVYDAETKGSICDAQVLVRKETSSVGTPVPVDDSCVYQDVFGKGEVFVVDVVHPSYASAHREGIRAKMVKADQCALPESVAHVDIGLER
jgi:hypothetical protein